MNRLEFILEGWKMQFLNDLTPQFDLTYSDVFLVPSFTNLKSRFDVNLVTPDNIGTTIPLIVSNMSAVAGKRMAETVARRGGLVILPQDIPLNLLESMIKYVKSRNLIYDTALTLKPSNTVSEALNIIYKRSHGAVIIVDNQIKPVGIFKEKDAIGYDRFTKLEDVLTSELVTISSKLTPEKMFEQLLNRHVTTAPVVEKGKLVGVVTQKGAVRSKIYIPATDKKNKLLVAVAMGINGDVATKASQLMDLGIDIVVIDTAHGHQKKMMDAIKIVRKIDRNIIIVAGNVVTAAGTKDLIDAGADIIKVGVGPGAMCTTRMMTGVGRPQFSAVVECSLIAKIHGKHVWADGGIRYPRDVALALAAGASNVMFGSLWAGTFESPGDALRDNEGRLYKESYGMASKRAIKRRVINISAFDQTLKEFFEEGINSSKLFIDKDRPGAEDIIDHIISGVRSSMAYAGANNIEEFYQKAIVGIQSSAGYQEGLAVDTSWAQ